MSKEIMKRSSKTAIVLPAHAKEMENNSNLLERALNSGVFLVFNIPTVGFFAQSSEPYFSEIGLSTFLISILAIFTIPHLSGKKPEIKTIRQVVNERFSKVPGLHFFANGTFHDADNKNLMIQMKHGKSIVYDITQPNPKDLWDKMYESETGRVVSKDFALLSTY